jgi:hypothetical protein
MATKNYNVEVWRKATKQQVKKFLGTVTVKATNAKAARDEAKSRFTTGEHKHLTAKVIERGF